MTVSIDRFWLFLIALYAVIGSAAMAANDLKENDYFAVAVQLLVTIAFSIVMILNGYALCKVWLQRIRA